MCVEYSKEKGDTLNELTKVLEKKKYIAPLEIRTRDLKGKEGQAWTLKPHGLQALYAPVQPK